MPTPPRPAGNTHTARRPADPCRTAPRSGPRPRRARTRRRPADHRRGACRPRRRHGRRPRHPRLRAGGSCPSAPCPPASRTPARSAFRTRAGHARPASKQAKPLPGHIQAAEQAARYAPQLGSDAASAIYQIARRGSLRQYSRVRAQLTALGYQDPDPPRVSLSPEGISLGELTEHFWDPWEVLLQAAASIAPPRPLSRSERWRYPDIAELADVLDIENASLDGINHALSTDPAFLAGWLRAVARAVELGPAGNRCPGTGRAPVLARGETAPSCTSCSAPPSAPAPGCDPARLAAADVTLLHRGARHHLGMDRRIRLRDPGCCSRSRGGQPRRGRAHADARGPT